MVNSERIFSEQRLRFLVNSEWIFSEQRLRSDVGSAAARQSVAIPELPKDRAPHKPSSTLLSASRSGSAVLKEPLQRASRLLRKYAPRLASC